MTDYTTKLAGWAAVVFATALAFSLALAACYKPRDTAELRAKQTKEIIDIYRSIGLKYDALCSFTMGVDVPTHCVAFDNIGREFHVRCVLSEDHCELYSPGPDHGIHFLYLGK